MTQGKIKTFGRLRRRRGTGRSRGRFVLSGIVRGGGGGEEGIAVGQ